MKKLWIKILAKFQRWPKACERIEAAMVTPFLALKDSGAAKRQAKQLADSKHFNSVASLIDLQVGGKRVYAGEGRTRYEMTKIGERNLRIALAAGITPIVIVRNDWASRTKQAFIPSIQGPAPVPGSNFYNDALLYNEKRFIDSLEPYYFAIHIQLNIEPDQPESASFALELARHLRSKGFKNRLLVNPYANSVPAHERLGPAFREVGVEWARSWNHDRPSPDRIHNTDGRLNMTPAAFERIRASGKEWCIWSTDLANSPDRLDDKWLK